VPLSQRISELKTSLTFFYYDDSFNPILVLTSGFN